MKTSQARKVFVVTLIVTLLVLGVVAGSMVVTDNCCPDGNIALTCSVHKASRLFEGLTSAASAAQDILVFAFVLIILFAVFSVSAKSLINLKIRMNT